MSTAEHLAAIKRHLENLLALEYVESFKMVNSARAGWKSTLAAIDGLLKIRAADLRDLKLLGLDESEFQGMADTLDTINAILAAWPIETLK